MPSDEDRAKIDAGAEAHALFLEICVESYKSAGGIGVAAFVAKTLRR